MQRLETIADGGAIAVDTWTAPSPAKPVVASATPVVTPRDQRLDMFRGLALVMIFVNHVPGTLYESWTSRNFGFSDAAEAFVFMSGLAAGLAYSKRFADGQPLWPAIARTWARARQLYFTHLTMTALTLAIFAGAAMWFGREDILSMNNLRPLFREPLGGMIGIPLMTHQLGYLNILPLYIMFLICTPAFLWIGMRKPFWLLGASVVLWAIAGYTNLNFPNFPNPGGWFFNPFSWQILFVIGLLCGIYMKQGRAFVPKSRALFWVCAAFVLFVLVWVKYTPLQTAGLSVLTVLHDAGVPAFITWFDKTFVALPRLLHALALFYVMASLAPVRWFADSIYSTPLKLMGRNGLAVFATGTVLSMVLQAYKLPMDPDPLRDAAILLGGLGLQVALGWALTKTTELKSLRHVA